MSEITRYNYEEFFLDYSEGTLTSLQRIALDDFLNENPDLKVELEEMDSLILRQDTSKFDSHFLKEIPFRESLDDFCIARLEGDLSASTEIAFDAFLEKNRESKKENLRFQKTILKPDERIVFAHKNQLKKKNRKAVYGWFFSGIAVAASILVLFTLGNLFSDFEGESVQKEQVVFVTSPAKPKALKAKVIQSLEPNTPEKLQWIPKKIAKVPFQKKLPKNIATKATREDQNIGEERASLRTEPIVLALESKSAPLANSELSEKELQVVMDERAAILAQNSGLEQLGMSWKSSVPKKKIQNSFLFAIAKFGVDKLEEIAGKNLQLEKKYDPVSEKTRFDFNTSGIGFSKTIK
jgi:hypothetical protein